jgi:hypothetical protein
MTHMRRWLGLGLGLAVLALVALAPLALAQMTPSVTVSDQPIVDNMVTVDTVVSDGPGWIVIHADDNGSPGTVLGHTAVSDGENTNVMVELATEGRTEMLWAMLHQDTGTVGTYEFPGGDPPVTLDGNIVMQSFMVTGGLAAAQVTGTPEMQTTEAMTATAEMTATEQMQATEAMTATEQMQATATPQPQTLPATGGGPTPWASLVLVVIGALVLVAGLGLIFVRR